MTTMLFLVMALFQSASRAPAADAQPGTGEIRGRVTDEVSGAPIVRATVQLIRSGDSPPLTVATDNDGRYLFAGLPAGTYLGYVSDGEYRATHVREPLRGADRRAQIVVKDGEVLTDVDVALTRSLAITVRVVDEWGEPLSGLSITATSAATGARDGESLRGTDDRGRLRVYQLPPGRYQVCADVGPWASVYRATSANRERFVRTCYPSASEAEAQAVRLEGTDVDDVEIRMRMSRTFTISGTVFDAKGVPPQGAFVSLSQFERNGSSSTGVTVQADGHFTVSNVLPGDYAVQARLGGADRPEQRRDLEVGFQPVTVDSSDVDGLIVSMSKGIDVAGRFVLEDTDLPFPKPGGSGLFLSARLAGDVLRGQGSSVMAHPSEDRTFLFKGMFGKRTLDVANIPRGWYVKSIRYAGKETIDEATEFKAGTDPSALEIVLSNRGATIAGRVLDERGEPVRGARVVMVPTGPARWGMFIDYVPASAVGAFRLGPQSAGDYTVVAVGPSGAMPQPRDRARFAQLAAAGERITLGENEERVLDLAVVKLDLVR